MTVKVFFASTFAAWIIVFGGWRPICMAAAETPKGAPDCTSALVLVGDCLKFVTGQADTPSPKCCSGVLNVHLHMPVCLCEFAENSGGTSAIPDYQPELAKRLPELCKIQDVHVSNCSGTPGQNATAPAHEGALPPRSGVLMSGSHKQMSIPRYSTFIALGIGACSILTINHL